MILTCIYFYLACKPPDNDGSSSCCCLGLCKCNCLKRTRVKLLAFARQYTAEINACIGLIGLGFHWWDIGMDFKNFGDYIRNGDAWWAFWTLIFILLPMIPASLAGLDLVCAEFHQVSLKKVVCVLVCITMSPIAASYFIAREIYSKYRCHTIDSGCELGPRHAKLMEMLDILFYVTAEAKTGAAPEAVGKKLDMIIKLGAIMKLWEVMGESYPQSVLQSFIVSQFLNVGKQVTSSQWFGISSSILSLAFSMTTHRLFDKIGEKQEGFIKIMIKLGLFVRFLLTVSSRISVACIFSMSKLIPIESTEMSIGNALQFGIVLVIEGFLYFVVTLVYGLYKSHQTRTTSQNDGEGSRITDSAASQALWTALFSTALDSLTIPGCAASIVNFVLAIGGGFLNEVPLPIRIVGVILSSITLCINLLSSFSRTLKVLRDDFQTGMENIFK